MLRQFLLLLESYLVATLRHIVLMNLDTKLPFTSGHLLWLAGRAEVRSGRVGKELCQGNKKLKYGEKRFDFLDFCRELGEKSVI